MKTGASVLGILLVIAGGIWIFQGIGVLPGSFMTGQTKWAVYGAIAVVCGAAIFIASRRTGGG